MHTICKTYFNPTEKHRLFIDFFSSIHLCMSSKKTKYLNWDDLFYWLKQTGFVFIILFLLTCKPMMQIWWIIISELVIQVKWHNLWSILKFCWCTIFTVNIFCPFLCMLSIFHTTHLRPYEKILWSSTWCKLIVLANQSLFLFTTQSVTKSK